MSMLDPTLRSTRGLMRRAALTISAALAFMGGAAWAQTEITFWHSMDSATETVDALVEAFHASQDEVRVDARMIGAYSEANTRLLAAFGGPDEPVLFQAEIGFLPRLVAEGATQPLTDLVDALPETLVNDFVPGLWAYGEFAGERHGLPWNSSTPVMYWNVDALRRAGIEPPTTWAEFEAAADALTSRQAQGVVFVGDSWLFEMMVLSRNGRLTDERGVPTLDSPEALAALTLLDELERRGSLAFFGANETTPAILGFVRTRSLVAFASIANWPDIRRFSVAFDMTAGPVPMEPGGAVPLGGAQLVVMTNATPAEREAAFQFWEFLMEPENLATWVEGSYYIPVRQSVVPLLDAFYAEVPGRGAALVQLDAAIPRPRIPEFEAMRGILDDMMEKVLRGRMTPEEALAEAQARALAEVAR